MTVIEWGDVYVAVCLLTLLFTPVLVVGWWMDRGPGLRRAWREYRQRAADLRFAREARFNGRGIWRPEHTDQLTDAGFLPVWVDMPKREADPSPRARPR